jgi:ATP-binding cassette subfamily B protein
MRRRRYPYYEQLDASDCGPSCLKMVAKFHGRNIPISQIRKIAYLNRQGTSLLSLSHAAESLGFKTIGVKIDLDVLKKEVPLPAILFWNSNHYVVLYRIKRNRYLIGDPGRNLLTITEEELKKSWFINEKEEGVALLLDPKEAFYDNELEEEKEEGRHFSQLFNYLLRYRRFFTYLLLGMLLGSGLELIIPFLTQAMIDEGVQNFDLNFVNLILFSQLLIFFASTFINAIRTWLLLHISNRINVTILSEFIYKLLKLPLNFFDQRMKGDILQRLNDHSRIQSFLTSSVLTTVFSFLNLIIFSIVLILYSRTIFLVFLAGSLAAILWVLYFMKARRIIDNTYFRLSAKNQNLIYELIDGIHELKLTNSEIPYQWKWENVQAKLFKASLKSLNIEQWQYIGNVSINELKNIFISYLSAKLVIEGDITLGIMVAISYIIGSLNGPIAQLLTFIRSAQDANISLNRLNDIHSLKEEDQLRDQFLSNKNMNLLLKGGNIKVQGLKFRYDGPGAPYVLDDINLEFLVGKVNAIVGVSGSGKTTLMKLLLKFYEPDEGDIFINDLNLANVKAGTWRQMCGVVMQDGFIFGDTIANNIAIGQEDIDGERLIQAAKIAQIHDFISKLALGYNTKIGSEGIGISMGQKQRILIARAVYKNPDFILFDEATSSLDANNENAIINNLNEFFQGKTAIIIAHRLSTVRNADRIIVLDQGKVAEMGNHQELLDKKGIYYRLINKQLF